ncbi:hypothetical protein Vi05172_g2291 [Venturia inaequalis]|nr:hypothetical protein Vi05172_g2291 [Venturia inaequalis]
MPAQNRPEAPKSLYHTLHRTYKIPIALALCLSGAIKSLLHLLHTIGPKPGEITDSTAESLHKISTLLNDLRPKFRPHRDKLPTTLRNELDAIERIVSILRKVDYNRLGTVSILQFTEECRERIQMLESGGVEWVPVRIEDREGVDREEVVLMMRERICRLEGELKRLQEGPAKDVGSFWHTPRRLKW